jgi:phage gp45-like
VTVQGDAARTDPALQRLRGLVRRLIATATRLPRWQLRGVRGVDGASEVVQAEVFQGVGFAARPPASSAAEVIAVNVDGQAKAPVVVATRDEKTAAAVRAAIGGLGPGDTLVYNAGVVVFLRSDGTVEIRSTGGTAVALALRSDLEALRTAIQNTMIAPGDGGAALKTAILAASWTTGTTVLKGE